MKIVKKVNLMLRDLTINNNNDNGGGRKLGGGDRYDIHGSDIFMDVYSCLCPNSLSCVH